MSQLFRVATIHEILPGQSKVIPLQGREIVLFNDRGTFHAVKNSCPNRGIPLDRGTAEEAILTCPGQVWRSSSEPETHWIIRRWGIRCYCVQIRGDAVRVEVL